MFFLSKLIKSDTDALKEELVIDHIYCLNKSQFVLHWIKDIEKEWKLWVNNHVVQNQNIGDILVLKIIHANLATRKVLSNVIVNNHSHYLLIKLKKSLSETSLFMCNTVFLEVYRSKHKSNNDRGNYLSQSDMVTKFRREAQKL